MRYIHGFFMSFGNFCAIPCPYRPWNEKARDLMLVFFPLVGLVIGILWYVLYLILQLLNFPIELSAAIMTVYPFLATGFIHLDGFMDTSDAILSRRPLEDKLRILKDPHTGAFAIVSLAILFLVSYGGMMAILRETAMLREGAIEGEILWSGSMMALLLIPVISRVGSSLTMLILKPLGHSQYHGKFKKKSARIHAGVVVAIGVAAFIAAVFLGINQLHNYDIAWTLSAGAIGYALAMGHAKRQLGGVSGDLAGYSLTLAETCSIIVLAVII
ncbi:MAG: adenosylcobinamide-GDP ribazoletransferase [Anaerovoracaceae bacterium]|jgi:adenosylcobinamide-GDP ribazoletransferase